MTSAEALTLRGRVAAEAQMVDTCTIDRPGAAVTDLDTGEVTTTSSRVYPTPEQIAAGNAGKCKVQSRRSLSVANPEAGGAAFAVVSREIHIPMNAADVQDGDVVTLTASKLNLFVVGKQYRVEGFEPDTFDTAARLPVKIL